MPIRLHPCEVHNPNLQVIDGLRANPKQGFVSQLVILHDITTRP
ncbi:hypothetical protein [Sporosarcina obsidiansis]|nr:hypothetical protein [Sporosarcina obsidiansis]